MAQDTEKDKQRNHIDAPTHDEATLNSLEATRNDMLSGKEKTYTLEETITNIRNHRRANGL